MDKGGIEFQKLSSAGKQIRTGILGLLTAFTPEILRSEYSMRIISGIISALRASSYELKLLMVRDEERTELPQKIFGKKKNPLDALLVLTWRLHAACIEEVQKVNSSLPVVLINDYTPGLKGNIVYTDSTEGARIAMSYLLNKGYRRMGMVQGPVEASLDARERERVFKETLNQEGIELDPKHFIRCDYFFEEDSYIRILELIHSKHPLPRAFFCFNDDLAVGAIRALREEKIMVPQEVAVLGFDGTERGKHLMPPLTTVLQPLEQMGREMVRIAIGLLRGELTAPAQIRFEPQLLIRQSA